MEPQFPTHRPFNPLIAGVLSFFIPGLGQLYKGKFLAAVLWLAAVSVGYFLLVVPGILLHIWCVIDAVVSRPRS